MSEQRRPRLKRHLSVVAHSVDVVELRHGTWNPVSYTLTDDGKSGSLLPVLSRPDGRASVPEIAAASAVPRRGVESVIERLDELELVEDQPSSALDHYLDHVVPSLLPFGGRPRVPAQPPLLLGHGGLPEQVGAILRHGLPDAGVEVLPADSPLLTALSGSGTSWLHDGFAFEREAEAYAGWQHRTVVYVSDVVHPREVRVLNRLSMHHRFSWLHAAVDGPFLLVGPTFLPFRTVCYECLDTRMLMNMREAASYQRYKQALAEGRVHGGLAPLDATVSALLASHTAFEALNLMTTGATFTVGKILAVYLPAMEFTYNEVLRLSGCPACAPAPEADDRELYFDVRALLDGAG